MAIKNNFSVYIDGINYTSRVVMPLKWGDFLDEQLDEAQLALRNCKRKIFLPLTPVEIRLKSVLYFGDTIVKTEEAVKRYVVANDDSEENLLGHGFYHHNLTLLEITKIAECIVVDTITFTNDIGRNYAFDDSLAEPEFV